jgi:multisubunit Na+/H+ antiporter MnhE subunit
VDRFVRHAVAWAAWWLALFWLWLLLAGDWNRIEWIAAACAATVAATVGELARASAGVRARVPLRWVARAWTVPAMVVVDFGILLLALGASLLRREVVRGSFRWRPFPGTAREARSPGVRAWATLAATYSPNAYVIDIDPRRRRVLVHDLVPFRRSEEPA